MTSCLASKRGRSDSASLQEQEPPNKLAKSDHGISIMVEDIWALIFGFVFQETTSPIPVLFGELCSVSKTFKAFLKSDFMLAHFRAIPKTALPFLMREPSILYSKHSQMLNLISSNLNIHQRVSLIKRGEDLESLKNMIINCFVSEWPPLPPVPLVGNGDHDQRSWAKIIFSEMQNYHGELLSNISYTDDQSPFFLNIPIVTLVKCLALEKAVARFRLTLTGLLILHG